LKTSFRRKRLKAFDEPVNILLACLCHPPALDRFIVFCKQGCRLGVHFGLLTSDMSPATAGALRWDQVDFERGMLHLRRVKNGTPSVHPLGGSEIRALRRLQREQPESRHVFLTERRSPMSAAGLKVNLV
jgi:integrase